MAAATNRATNARGRLEVNKNMTPQSSPGSVLGRSPVRPEYGHNAPTPPDKYSTDLEPYEWIKSEEFKLNEPFLDRDRKYHLKRHKRTHGADSSNMFADESLFHCELCGKNFSCKSTLKSHQVVHTDTMPVFLVRQVENFLKTRVSCGLVEEEKKLSGDYLPSR
uniref:C2H2-type domain-containing protein n=1 Tax=Timema shepardi TaxID=629360 RepID=A0A7R9FVH0_TIMSH|nr:unnamed protein product [Timema shepardi]